MNTLPIVGVDNAERLNAVVSDIQKTLNHKGKKYSTSPIRKARLETLLAQLELKAMRAALTVQNADRIDELRDTACYAILILARVVEEMEKAQAQTELPV